MTHTGDLQLRDAVVPATGLRIAINGVTVAEFEDDRICALRQYWDELAVYEQLGLVGENSTTWRTAQEAARSWSQSTIEGSRHQRYRASGRGHRQHRRSREHPRSEPARVPVKLGDPVRARGSGALVSRTLVGIELGLTGLASPRDFGWGRTGGVGRRGCHSPARPRSGYSFIPGEQRCRCTIEHAGHVLDAARDHFRSAPRSSGSICAVCSSASLRCDPRLRGGGRRAPALFGLWHLHAALGDAKGDGLAAALGTVIGTIAVTTVAGALFAYLRLRSGSLAAPVLAHCATNSFAYVGAVIVLHL